MAKKPVDKRIDESNSIIAGIDIVAEGVMNKSEKLKDSAIDKAIELNGVKTPYTASSLVARNVDLDLKKIIKDSNASFSDFVEATQRYLADNYAINLTKKDLDIISNKGSEITEDLVANTKILKKDIQNILTRNLAQGVPEKQLVKELKNLYPAYSRNASTLVNTGLSRIYTDTNVAKFRKSDFQWYIWAGPKDKLTREIPCQHWVWHRFPASQLATITAVRMRLWNCRHSIIPISDEEIGQYEIGDISYA